MPFGLRTRVGPRNHVLDEGPDPTMQRGNFEGGRGGPLLSIGTLYGHVCKNSWTNRDAILVMDSGGPKEACIRWGQDPPCEGAILRGKRTCLHMPYDTLPWAVQKWLNQSIYCLGCGGWAKGSTSTIVFTRWRQCALTGRHIGAMRAHWRHLANMIEPSVCSGNVALCQITVTTYY